MSMYLVCYGTPSPRAVMIGESDTPPVIGQPCSLRNARMVLWWDAACGGLFGLAAAGPKGSATRITHAVPSWSVTPAEVAELSEVAVAALAAWPSA